MTDDDVQAMVGPHYTALADLLEQLPADRWDAASMCAGWRVREVIAHVTMPAHYDEAAFMAEMQADGFDFGKLSDRLAERDAQRPTADLIASLRSPVLHAWQPPGGGAHGALNHAVIHGLDVTVPLGAPRASTDEAMRTVLDALTRGGGHQHFGVDISGRSFFATDLDWSFGDGEPVSGTVDDLVLHLAGRAVLRSGAGPSAERAHGRAARVGPHNGRLVGQGKRQTPTAGRRGQCSCTGTDSPAQLLQVEEVSATGLVMLCGSCEGG